MVVVAPLTTRRERALRCALGRWQAVCRRLLDEASTAGAVAAPADRRLRRQCVDGVRAPVAAWHGVAAALPAFDKRVVAGFSASRDASPRWGGSRAARPGRVGARRGAFGSVYAKQASGAPRGAICYPRPRRTEPRTDWRRSHRPQ